MPANQASASGGQPRNGGCVRTIADVGPIRAPTRAATRLPPSSLARRRAHRTIEGPATDVIDLLLHRLRQRYDVGRGVEQVLVGQLAILQPDGGERRDHALLDLRTCPPPGELLERLEVEAGGIDAAAAQVDAEDVEALLVERQVDEEHLVEAALADHLGGQQVDAVRGGADEEAARLLLHPGEEEAEHAPQLAFLRLRADAGLDLVEPGDGGRDRLEEMAGARERRFRLAVEAREHLDHVDAVERQLERGRDGLDRQALAAAGDAHDEAALRDDLGAQLVAHLEQLAAVEQPLLHDLETADVVDTRDGRQELDDARPVDQRALLLEQRGQRLAVERVAHRARAPDRVPRLVQGEPLERARHLMERPVARVGGPTRRNPRLGLGAREGGELVDAWDGQGDEHRLVRQLVGQLAHGRADDDELAAIDAGLVEVAQPTADLGRAADRLVEVLQQEEAGAVVPVDELERLARAERLGLVRAAVTPHALGEAPDPERHRRRERLGRRGAQQARDARLLRGADVGQRAAGGEYLVQRTPRLARLWLRHGEDLHTSPMRKDARKAPVNRSGRGACRPRS